MNVRSSQRREKDKKEEEQRVMKKDRKYLRRIADRQDSQTRLNRQECSQSHKAKLEQGINILR